LCHVFVRRAFIIAVIAGTSTRIGDLQILKSRTGSAESDGKLILEARTSAAAFTKLYRRHYDAVFRYCVHRLFEKQAAEDVTSTVFLKVVESFGSFQGSEPQFRTWLYRIATNAVNNHLREVARRHSLLERFRELVGRNTTDCPASMGESTDKLSVLKNAMLTLKPRYQTVITLRFFENMKLTEIAEVLGCSAGTARSQLARALAKLRKHPALRQQEIAENE
jgi:RNA polymerase sigma factor (sigma-70 family)